MIDLPIIDPRPPEFDIPEKCESCGRVMVYRDNHGLRYCTACAWNEFPPEGESR